MALSKFNDFREKLKRNLQEREEDVLFLRRNEMEYVTATVIAAGQLSAKQKQKSPEIIRDKTFLENGDQNWSNAMFKKKLRVR